MNGSAENDILAAKKRFYRSLFILALSVLYLIVPFDIVPDILGPLGIVDDIPLLLGSLLYSWYTYRKMKKEARG